MEELIMNEREKITVVANDGQERQGEIIMDVTLESTGKNYILYTFNEVDEKGLETIYASAVDVVDGKESLNGIATEEEWTEIKKIMKEVIKENQQNNK